MANSAKNRGLSVCRLAMLLCLGGLSSLAMADDEGWLDRLLTKLGASKEVDLSHGIDWGVLPGPFFNPEMGLGIGVAAVGLYKPANAEKDTQLSTLTMKGFASTKGALGLGFDNNTFFADDSYRFVATGGLVNMPTSYWGIGYDRDSNDANKESYTKHELFLQPKMLWRVRPNTYVGAGLNLQYDEAAKRELGDQSAFVSSPGGPTVFSSGVSAHFSYDTRDFLPNPYSGQAFMLNGTWFRQSLGSDQDFEVAEWSYDTYYRLRERDVLAFDIYGRFSWGDVPWSMMSLLGDNKRMRGYFLGQYRDKDMMSAQVEYRRHLVGRHGLVFWAGTGAIADSVGKLGSARWLPNAGVGYRFEFKPRVNVRFDVGAGKDTAGVYFQLNEAF